MDERQDIEKKDKNIAQLMVELTTVQAQIKLVKAAIFMNKQKAAISTKMKDFKTYAEGQAEKYSQNMEEANKAMETYKSAVEEAMQQYAAALISLFIFLTSCFHSLYSGVFLFSLIDEDSSFCSPILSISMFCHSSCSAIISR